MARVHILYSQRRALMTAAARPPHRQNRPTCRDTKDLHDAEGDMGFGNPWRRFIASETASTSCLCDSLASVIGEVAQAGWIDRASKPGNRHNTNVLSRLPWRRLTSVLNERQADPGHPLETRWCAIGVAGARGLRNGVGPVTHTTPPRAPGIPGRTYDQSVNTMACHSADDAAHSQLTSSWGPATQRGRSCVL